MFPNTVMAKESLTLRARQGGMCRCRSRERARHGDVMAVIGNVTSGERSGGGDDWGPWDGWMVSLVCVGSSCRRTAYGRERIMCMCLYTLKHMSLSPRAFTATRPHASLHVMMLIQANHASQPSNADPSALVSLFPSPLNAYHLFNEPLKQRNPLKSHITRARLCFIV